MGAWSLPDVSLLSVCPDHPALYHVDLPAHISPGVFAGQDCHPQSTLTTVVGVSFPSISVWGAGYFLFAGPLSSLLLCTYILEGCILRFPA